MRSPIGLKHSLVAAAVLATCLNMSAAQAQEQETEPPAQGERGRGGDRRLRWIERMNAPVLNVMRSLGPWEDQAEQISRATELVFERNEWNSESDLFTLDLVTQIQQIPPWEVNARLDALCEGVAGRYQLDDAQRDVFRDLILRDAAQTFAKHGPTLAAGAMKLLSTRAAGDAITPELVAEIAEASGGVIDDAREMMKRSKQEFIERARPTPDQLALMDQDLSAAERRIERVSELQKKWARREWQPEDWGIEDDPIQRAGEEKLRGNPPAAEPGDGSKDTGADTGSAASARRAGGDEPGGMRKTQPSAQNGEAPAHKGREPSPVDAAARDKTDEWVRYTAEFIAAHKLEDGQARTAWRVCDSLTKRREAVRTAAQRKRDAMGVGDSANSATKELTIKTDQEIARLFDQLRKRLNKLPNRAQKRDAEAAGWSSNARSAATQPSKR